MKKEFGIAFSNYFDIDEKWLKRNSVFNPTLDVDSPLFIDPFLLPHSRHMEFAQCAFETYERHFIEIYRLLRIAREPGDKAWSAALRKVTLGESNGLNGTCLGYSKKSTSGRGFGPVLSARALEWAQQVIDLGVEDPELFSSISLFETGISADLISDMVLNISLDCVISFNHRILNEIRDDLKVDLETEYLSLGKKKVNLLRNPFNDAPVILVAEDILKYLPIMEDVRSLREVAETNEDLRDKVNIHIGEIFRIRTKKEKDQIKRTAMENAASFQTLLDLLKILEKRPYDFYKDPEGLLEWRQLAENFTAIHKLEIRDNQHKAEIDRVNDVTTKIINQFQALIEDNRFSEAFYVDGEPRHERFAQLLFFAIAIAYCNANNLDISPEADAGAGPVDFKFSNGTRKVVVEIKLSTNPKVVHGYQKQLDAYMKAERTENGHYVVIDVGKIGKKLDKLNEILKENPKFSELRKVHVIDGSLRPSASKL